MPNGGYFVGLGQILVEGGQPEANLARAVSAIRTAADEGCRLVVLPECLDLGWTDPSARTLAQPIPGPHAAALAAAARDCGVYVPDSPPRRRIRRSPGRCARADYLVIPDRFPIALFPIALFSD